MKFITYRNKKRKLVNGAILIMIGDYVLVKKSGSDWVTSGTTIYQKRSIRVPKKYFADVKLQKLNKKGYYRVVE